MYNNTATVAILLATYNSADYLSQQLDSLFDQTYKDWHIFIHDDGSTDSTLDVVNNYAAKYGKITVLIDDKKKLGATFNFVHILNNVNSRYYMFCDHDDVWLPNKIAITVEEIGKIEAKYPQKAVLVHTDLQVVDKDLTCISSSLWQHAQINPRLLKQKEFALVSYFATGCTMGFNAIAKKELAIDFPNDKYFLHDAWIALQAVYKDAIIVSVDEPTILYRLHGNNAAGVPKIGITYYLKRLSFIRKFATDLKDKRPYLDYFNYGSFFKYLYYKAVYSLKR